MKNELLSTSVQAYNKYFSLVFTIEYALEHSSTRNLKLFRAKKVSGRYSVPK